MRNHRLHRLALLTQGVALVGLGMSQLACGKDGAPPGEPIHVNSPAPTPPTPPTPPAPVAEPKAPEPIPSATAQAVAPTAPPTTMPHMNAPPKKPPPAPTK
jgi:hypothetical protein